MCAPPVRWVASELEMRPLVAPLDGRERALCRDPPIDEAKLGGDEATVGKAYYVLAREAYWAGAPQRALEDARQGSRCWRAPMSRSGWDKSSGCSA